MKDLRSPRMVLLHAVVLLVVLVLSRLGLWQLDRLGEANTRADERARAAAAAPVALADLLPGLAGADDDELAAAEFRPVTATGTWRPEDEVLQRGRALNGRSGYHVLTPLDLDAGGTVLVRRGWVPFDNDLLPPVAEAAPPTGTVVVTGVLEQSTPQPTGGVVQRDPDDGALDVVFHADLDRLGPQLGADLAPMLVWLQGQEPAPPGDLPVPAPLPDAAGTPHLSYAIQWFSFAVIAGVTYLVWLRRRVRAANGLRSDAQVRHL